MSDDEHQDRKTGTFQQQAYNIRKGSYLVIQNGPCKVQEVSSGNYGRDQCHFVAIDIFTGEKFEDTVPSSHDCDVPWVCLDDYQLIDISDDGYTDAGSIKDDVKLPTYGSFADEMKYALNEGKDVLVTVQSAMGEEHICTLRDVK